MRFSDAKEMIEGMQRDLESILDNKQINYADRIAATSALISSLQMSRIHGELNQIKRSLEELGTSARQGND